MGMTDIRVLIVDDDPDMRATLHHFISNLGVKVVTAGDVVEAQRILRTEVTPFDLILTDLRLPRGSGLDILRAARARNPESLVTIVTGYASLETAIEAIRLGAYDYVTKPFSLDEIGVQVRNMIERVSLSKENARLSVRLQELYEQVNRLHNERAEMTRLHEEIRDELLENRHRLDLLISSPPGGRPEDPIAKATSLVPTRLEEDAVSSFFRGLEKLNRLKACNSLSPSELENEKRCLIEEVVEKL